MSLFLLFFFSGHLFSAGHTRFGLARQDGGVETFCRMLNDEYSAKAADRDREKIVKIYTILKRSFCTVSSREQDHIIRTIQKGFRYEPPSGASVDFRELGVECLTGMGTKGLEALLFSLDHNRVDLNSLDGLMNVLDEEYKSKDKDGRDEKEILCVYKIFEAVYEKTGPSEMGRILDGLEKAFSVKTFPDEGGFKIAAAGYLAGMGTSGLDSLIRGMRHHKKQKLTYPPEKWDPVLTQLRDVAYAEYSRRKKCDDYKVIQVFELFQEIFPHALVTEQRSMAAYIIKAFQAFPVTDQRLSLLIGAESLSRMGKPGLEALKYLLKSEYLEDSEKILESVIISIGLTKNTSVLNTLCQLLWDDDAVVVSAACKALTYYRDLPLKTRKPIVEEVVKVYAYLHSLAMARRGSPIYSGRLGSVESSMNKVLRALTSQSFNSAPRWQKWYNDNKGKRKW